MPEPYRVVDLFAGPGGLAEGFASVPAGDGRPSFKIALSIEKELTAHRTLRLRALFRLLRERKHLNPYYAYVRGEETWESFSRDVRMELAEADNEAWCAELGVTPQEDVASRVQEAVGPAGDRWALIGGPPCQAYSLIGRARMRGRDPEAFAADHRHFLYREYLKILAEYTPPVFVMENVKGLLSSQANDKGMFDRIVEDLERPAAALHVPVAMDASYRLYGVSTDARDGVDKPAPRDFVVRSEDHGLPQRRHRVILIGIRTDLIRASFTMPRLAPSSPGSVCETISDLPQVRSGLSGRDALDDWVQVVDAAFLALQSSGVDPHVSALGKQMGESRGPQLTRGGRFISGAVHPSFRAEWFEDGSLGGVLNHETRGHMREDLGRYVFAATFARAHGHSPSLGEFPSWLLPEHRNVGRALREGVFNDRFRVQVANKPSTTITSHISKDGHYYIHPDPRQCRSLTVREAARLQTFPDNYFFEGPRTSQYVQVGNAVPPLLAAQIGEVVRDILNALV